VRLFDHRKLSASNSQGTPIEQFEGPTAAVLCVQVHPTPKALWGTVKAIIHHPTYFAGVQ